MKSLAPDTESTLVERHKPHICFSLREQLDGWSMKCGMRIRKVKQLPTVVTC